MAPGCALALLALAAMIAAAPDPAGAQLPAIPIIEGPHDEPELIGSAATRRPIAAPSVPQNPFMAPNGRSNLHVDAYASDVNDYPGPLGAEIETTSTLQLADCASLTFDSAGRVETICVGLDGPRLALFDPHSLDLLATFLLPPRQSVANPFTQFGGGGYFYLDQRDRAVIPTTDRRIFVVSQTDGPAGPGFALQRQFDLNSILDPDDSIVSALPDWSGNIWLVSSKGVVAFVEPGSGQIHSLTLAGEGITNSFALDETGGVFVVSDRAMYRFDVDSVGEPAITWREVYDNTLTQKPGQVDDGSGTTPTLMGDDLVAITDNDDPMKVVVYRRAASVSGARLVCAQPVFDAGRSATDNSLIATDRSIVVENNYGYAGPATTVMGGTTTPGVERVDLDPGGSGCHTVWHSDVTSPTVVPKLSLDNGLVYVYAKKADDDDPWYLTAIDFRTGATVYQRLAGTGLGFNNNYAPVTLGPDGSAYVGVLGGLALLRDTAPADARGGGGGATSALSGSADGSTGGDGGRGKKRSGGGNQGGETAGANAQDASGSLPFTGLGLAAMLVAAAAALGGGLLLRRLR